jgi:hypothetical protein
VNLDAALGPFIAGFSAACLIFVGVVVALTFLVWP